MDKSSYTYRIHITDSQLVRIQKLDDKGNILGEPVGAFKYEENRRELDSLCLALQKNEIDEAGILQLGRLLFNTLFDPVLRLDFLSLYQQVIYDDKRLRIEMIVDEHNLSHIAALPWEFMSLSQDAGKGTLWLATAPNLIFSRRTVLWSSPLPLILSPKERLRIALIVSSPDELGPVAYKTVWQTLNNLAELMPDQIKLLPLVEKATLENIDNALALRPHIIHIIGHGRVSEYAEQTVNQIALVKDSSHDPLWCSAELFNDLFLRHRPGVVVFQPCAEADWSTERAFIGMASRMVQQIMPVAVALQFVVNESIAARFFQNFYSQLAELESVDQAVQASRRSVALQTGGYSKRDFAMPIIFSRVRDGRLFVTKPETTTLSEATQDEPLNPRIDVSLPSLVEKNRTFELNVAIRYPQSSSLKNQYSDQTQLGILWSEQPETTKKVPIRVQISAPECTIAIDSRSFTLSRGMDSPIIYFQLVPQNIGRISIVVSVYQDSNWVGDTRLHTMAQEQVVNWGKANVYHQSLGISHQVKVAVARQIELVFKSAQLRTLCFDLDIEYDNLWGETLGEKARALVGEMVRNGRFPDLIQECQNQRPNVNWEELADIIPAPQPSTN